jgi:hypothetical protein
MRRISGRLALFGGHAGQIRDRPRQDRARGWRAAETFDTGLAKTVRWYLSNRRWSQAILERGYKAERVGLSQVEDSVVPS